MKRAEEICERFYKSEKALEEDLMLVMRQKIAGEEPPAYIKGNYLNALLGLLIDMGCLEDTGWISKATEKGKDDYKRGWILYDYITPKRREMWKSIREWATLTIAVIGTIIGFFCPVQKAPQGHLIFVEFKGMVPDTTINLATHIDEIAQATDSTKQKSCNNDK